MNDFEQYVYDLFETTIKSWSASLREDIYALCICERTFWSQVESALIRPESSYGPGEIIFEAVLSLSYVCLSEWEADSDDKRKKWFRPWPYRGGISQIPQLPEFGCEPNASEMALRDEWCKAKGIYPIAKDATGRPTYGDDFYLTMSELKQSIALLLHSKNVMSANFSDEVPVIIVTEESVIDIKQTVRANPASVLFDLLRYNKSRP